MLPHVSLPYIRIIAVLEYLQENGGWETLQYEVENLEHRVMANNRPENAPPLPANTNMENVFEITREGARLMENYPSLGEHCSEEEGAGDDEVIPPPLAPLPVPPPVPMVRRD